MLTYTVSPVMKQVAMYFATIRNKKEELFGTVPFNPDTKGVLNNYIGICGEIAVAELIGGKIDLKEYEEVGDNGIDLVIDNIPVDVKTTRYILDPWLKVEEKKIEENHCYVLCSFDTKNDVVYLVGRCTGAYLKKNGTRRQLCEHCPVNYVLPSNKIPKFTRFRKGLDIE